MLEASCQLSSFPFLRSFFHVYPSSFFYSFPFVVMLFVCSFLFCACFFFFFILPLLFPFLFFLLLFSFSYLSSSCSLFFIIFCLPFFSSLPLISSCSFPFHFYISSSFSLLSFPPLLPSSTCDVETLGACAVVCSLRRCGDGGGGGSSSGCGSCSSVGGSSSGGSSSGGSSSGGGGFRAPSQLSQMEHLIVSSSGCVRLCGAGPLSAQVIPDRTLS